MSMQSYEALAPEELMPLLRDALDRTSRAEVNAIVSRLIELDAPMGRQWRTLAIVLNHNGEHENAIEAIRRFVMSQGNGPAAKLEEVFTLHAAGRISQAYDVLRGLPASLPTLAENAYLLGSMESMLGRAETARASLDRAVALDPSSGRAWLARAMVARVTSDDGFAKRVTAADPRLSGPPMAHADAYFAGLGKALDDLGQIDQAFDAFAEAAVVARRREPYDGDAERMMAQKVLESFTSEAINRVAERVTIDTSRPIFVTGNPRSGTTLVEQILASHSAIADGGELDLIRIVLGDVGGPLASDLATYISRTSPNAPAGLYLHLLDQRFGRTGRIIDKRLLASRTLGLIAATLPQAPLIWMRRDPLDCAWSCFRNHFTKTAAWSNDFEDIARHFLIEDEMLAGWQRRLGDRLLVVPYEELVASPALWTRRIIAHCGLDEERTVFAPHKTMRAVTTASVMQVREPINRKGIGVAEPYRKFMQPFIDAYYSGTSGDDQP